MHHPVSFCCRRVLPVLLTFLLLMTCVIPALAEESALTATFGVLQDPEFGSVYLDCTPDNFTGLGFRPGDSCDVRFSNGFQLEDLPVYTGYNTKTGYPLIVLYPGYEHPALAYSSGGSMWESSGAQDGDTVTVTLREREKYLAVEEAMALRYSNDRNDFASDAVFSNFRELTGGKLRAGMFFRGASPVDDKNGRATITDTLIRDAGIGFILDLADSYEKAAAYPLFPGSRFEALSFENNVFCAALTANYRDPAYAASLANGLRAMTQQDQPVYIHCTEGKDRTGFVCLLLEALAGANYEELLADYMITYDNYYGITEASDPQKFIGIAGLKFRDMLDWLAGVPEGTDLSGQTFEQGARDYLTRAGMTDAEIDTLNLYLRGEHRTGFDWDILYGIQNLHGDFLNNFFLTLTTIAGDYGHLWLILGAVLLIFKKTRKCGFAVLLGYALVYGIGQFVLKDLIARPRPCHIDQSVALLLKRPSSYSCPSTHSAWAFAAATAVLLNHKKSGLAVLAVALLIAFSRLYLFVHFPTDVLAGIALGVVCGFCANFIVKKIGVKASGIRA